MSSLFDLPSMMHFAVSMGQLEQTQRHNDILEQRTDLDRSAQELTKQKLRYDMATRGFDEIEKLMGTPQVALNPQAQLGLQKAQFQLLKHGLGVQIDLPSDEELLGAGTQAQAMARTLLRGTQEEKAAALEQLTIAAPKYGIKFLTELKQMNDLSVQGEMLRLKLLQNQTALEANNLKMGRAKMAQGLFAEHLGAVSTTIGLGGDERFKDDFAKVLAYEKPETRQTFLKIRPDFQRPFEDEVKRRAAALPQVLEGLDQEISARRDALVQAQTQTGEAPQHMVEELQGYVAAYKARQAELEWTANPYDKTTWKALKTAQQNLRVRLDGATKQATDINEQRLKIAQQKFDAGEQTKLASAYVQKQFLTYLDQGHKDNQAALLAMKDAEKEFPGVPVDPGKIENYEKKGRLGVEVIQPGKELISDQFKGIEDAMTIINAAQEMVNKIEKSPGIVGGFASMGAGMAGLIQQVRGLGGLGLEENSKLNTKQRDELEALGTMLAYATAKANDKGSLDVKAVEAARQQMGEISSFTSGHQQVVNKLNLALRQAKARLAYKREFLRTAGQSAFVEQPAAPVESSTQPPRTADEFLKKLGVTP